MATLHRPSRFCGFHDLRKATVVSSFCSRLFRYHAHSALLCVSRTAECRRKPSSRPPIGRRLSTNICPLGKTVKVENISSFYRVKRKPTTKRVEDSTKQKPQSCKRFLVASRSTSSLMLQWFTPEIHTYRCSKTKNSAASRSRSDRAIAFPQRRGEAAYISINRQICPICPYSVNCPIMYIMSF